jgi:hypothetical protein
LLKEAEGLLLFTSGSLFLSQSRRLPHLQMVSINKLVSVGGGFDAILPAGEF